MPGTWSVHDALGADDERAVRALLKDVERRTHDEALTEDQRERLDRGEASRHALRRDGGAVTGYAIVVPGDPVLVEPALGSYDDGLATLLEGLGGAVTLLLRPAPAAVTDPLEARGWRPVRTLRRLRRPLPADPPPPTELGVRPFRPGVDDAAWVAQNNAAFKGHPSQGSMTLDRLARKLAQPWFDAAGFLLLFRGDDLVASCWTKVHRFGGAPGRRDVGPDDVGEIYVISVAPGAQAGGLGRLAVLLGLAHLATLGLTTAELFVEDDNARAIALYASLGFVEVSRVAELFLDRPGQPAPTARPTP